MRCSFLFRFWNFVSFAQPFTRRRATCAAGSRQQGENGGNMSAVAKKNASRGKITWPSVLLFILIGSGVALVGTCAGYIVPMYKEAFGGEAVASFLVSPGDEFRFEYPTRSQASFSVWLEYEIAHRRPLGDWSIDGTMKVSASGHEVDDGQIHIGRVGSPVVGRGDRIETHTRTTLSNGQGTSSASIRIFKIPKQDGGQTITVAGLVRPGPDTQIRSLRCVLKRHAL